MDSLCFKASPDRGAMRAYVPGGHATWIPVGTRACSPLGMTTCCTAVISKPAALGLPRTGNVAFGCFNWTNSCCGSPRSLGTSTLGPDGLTAVINPEDSGRPFSADVVLLAISCLGCVADIVEDVDLLPFSHEASTTWWDLSPSHAGRELVGNQDDSTPPSGADVALCVLHPGTRLNSVLPVHRDISG